jgi:hypothetical protein
MAAKISFPNRACPKCGKPIHIKSKTHPACGWTGGAVAGSGSKESSNGKPMSKMEAVRRILTESGNDAMPLDIQAQLKKKFGIKMEATTISNYKGIIIRGGAPKKIGRPKGTKLGRPPGGPSVAKASGTANISIEDIRAVKALAERLGADKLRQLTEVLA